MFPIAGGVPAPLEPNGLCPNPKPPPPKLPKPPPKPPKPPPPPLSQPVEPVELDSTCVRLLLSIVSLVEFGLDLFEEAERLEERPLLPLLERVEALRLESALLLFWLGSNPPKPNPFATAAPTIAARVNLQNIFFLWLFFILSVIY